MSVYSRYDGLPLAIYNKDDEGIQYITRRFLPHGDDIRTLQDTTVNEGDRADLISHKHLNSSNLWWRIADKNDVMEAEDLEQPGKKLSIPSTYEVNPKLFPQE